MVALAAVLLALAAGPPSASLSTAAGHFPLAVSSWCWAKRCGAPIAASKRVARTARGDTVRVELGFAARTAKVIVGGIRMKVTMHGRELSWSATRGGGVAIRVTERRGWVAYVGRLRLH